MSKFRRRRCKCKVEFDFTKNRKFNAKQKQGINYYTCSKDREGANQTIVEYIYQYKGTKK